MTGLSAFAVRGAHFARRQDGRERSAEVPASSASHGGRDLLPLGATVLAALVIWCLRRPDQLLHPYVWADEYHVLNRYQAEGLLASALAPVKGYFIWPTSFSVASAAWLSFLHLPTIEYWCATGWFVLTICLVMVPRSFFIVGTRALLAIFVVLAPTNPEVFGVALYTFWWTSLWPAIALTWTKDIWWLRGPVLVLGGMSSLAGAAMVVPYAVVAAIRRERRDVVSCTILACTAVTQGYAYVTSARASRTPLYPVRVGEQELRNFGYFPLAWAHHPSSLLLAALGVIVLGFLVLFVVPRLEGPPRQIYAALLIGALVVGVLCSVPTPLYTNPAGTGPRYYFLPFVLVGWELIVIAAFSRARWRQTLAAGLLVTALAGTITNFSRYEPALNWEAQLARCAATAAPFYVPVQFSGPITQMWRSALVIEPETCRSLGYRRAST